MLGPRVSSRSFSRKNQSENTEMIENKTNLEPDRSGRFEHREQAHSNAAEAKKENVKTARRNELGKEEHETEQDPNPPVHILCRSKVAEVGRNFKLRRLC
jgi:hypothetical protein